MCFEESIFQVKVTLISAKCEYSSIQVHECKTADESLQSVKMKCDKCSIIDKKP